jgi:hypothetical protein
MPIRLSLAILIAAGVTAAQQDPSSHAAKGTVLVRVLDAATGQPISGASVGAGEIRVRTDADGRARLESLSAGARWVNASADGYLHQLEAWAPRMFDRMVAPPETDARRWAARNPQFPGTLPVAVKPNAEVEVDFRLPRGGSIQGRVLTPDGAPVRGVSVKALVLYSESRDTRVFVPVDAIRTDQDGRFMFSGLKPSPHYLRVETGYDDEFARVPIFYPSETSPRRAQPIDVRSSETARVEIGLRYVQPLPITGTVVDAQGRPVAGETRIVGTMPVPSVGLTRRRLDTDCCSDSIQNLIEEVDARGRFRTAPLPPGTYRFKSGIHVVSVVHESTSVEHVVVQIHERAVMSGRIVPRSAAMNEAAFAIDLTPEDGPWERRGTTKADSEGAFAVGVSPGRYRVSVQIPEPWVATAVKLEDGRNVIDEAVVLRPGETLDGVIVEVGEGARITGKVFPSDMMGVHGYEVIAFPAARELWRGSDRFYKEAWTNERDNTFTIEGLAPGIDYLVAVHPWGAMRPAIAMEKWLEELSRNAVRVSAPKAGTYRADIDLEKHR